MVFHPKQDLPGPFVGGMDASIKAELWIGSP